MNNDLVVLDDGADEQQNDLPFGPDLARATANLRYVPSDIEDGLHGTQVAALAVARRNSGAGLCLRARHGLWGACPDVPCAR